MKGIAKTMVTEANVANAVGSGSLQFFSTPMKIALMEQATCAAQEESLAPGQTSVGTALNIQHLAASQISAEITATATVEEMDRRQVEFTVVAHEGAKEIGKGKHTRFIVEIEKFLAKLKQTA